MKKNTAKLRKYIFFIVFDSIFFSYFGKIHSIKNNIYTSAKAFLKKHPEGMWAPGIVLLVALAAKLCKKSPPLVRHEGILKECALEECDVVHFPSKEDIVFLKRFYNNYNNYNSGADQNIDSDGFKDLKNTINKYFLWIKKLIKNIKFSVDQNKKRKIFCLVTGKNCYSIFMIMNSFLLKGLTFLR